MNDPKPPRLLSHVEGVRALAAQPVEPFDPTKDNSTRLDRKWTRGLVLDECTAGEAGVSEIPCRVCHRPIRSRLVIAGEIKSPGEQARHLLWSTKGWSHAGCGFWTLEDTEVVEIAKAIHAWWNNGAPRPATATLRKASSSEMRLIHIDDAGRTKATFFMTCLQQLIISAEQAGRAAE